jgi:hypothetical protein
MFGYFLVSVRCLLALVLAASSLGKVRHPLGIEQFARVLSLGLGVPHARLVAGGWVAAEGLTALLLVPPSTVRAAAALATAEFALLTAGAAVLVAQRRGFSCPCFGGGQAPLSWWSVLRNAALTAAALLLAFGLRLSRAGTPAPVVLAAVLTVAVGAVLCWQAPALRSLTGHARPGWTAGPEVPGPTLATGGRR